MMLEVFFMIVKLYGAVYVATCLHEIGHTIAVKMMNGTVQQVHFGEGKEIFHYKKIHIRIKPGGSVQWDNSEHHVLTKNEKIFICSAGVFINFLMFWMMQLTTITKTFLHLESFPYISFLDWFCLVLIVDLINLLPIKDTDGKQIKDLLMVKHLKKEVISNESNE